MKKGMRKTSIVKLGIGKFHRKRERDVK